MHLALPVALLRVTLRVSHFESHFDEGFWGNTVNTLRVTLMRVSGVTLLTL